MDSKERKNGNGDGSYLDRFGIKSENAAVERVRIKGNSGGRQKLLS